MISIHEKTPSEKCLKMLENLKKVVTKALERKRKLGQYFVIWDGEKPVQRGPDAPASRG